ncbi:MAG: portal protein [Robiginitomaculum sp.]|nr:MAG: portal protein [Robiginitomaculum sp.]
MAELFGFSIIRKKSEEKEEVRTFVDKSDEDGATTIAAIGGSYGTFVDLEGSAQTEAKLVTQYREIEHHPEVRRAIDDIVNEAIVVSDDAAAISINLDQTDLSSSMQKTISNEFEEVLRLMDFSNKGYDIFNRYYVDGRLRFHIIIDEKNVKAGIKELRMIDPRKIKRIREVEKVLDSKTNAVLKRTKNEYFVYNEAGFLRKSNLGGDHAIAGIRISTDSIAEVTSGILNETNTIVLSYLHQSMKPLNQLKMLEDSSVIYRLARAPERRIFYIDVGNLPRAQAEQYLRDMMTKHKNRLVYDASTGEVRNDKKHMTMLEDFWLPRRDGKGTEVTNLPGGANLGEIEDIVYFQKNLYKALNVPVSRMESDTGFSIGRSSEITRDEIKFSKFINRVRTRFSIIFDEILERQLVLKNIMTLDDFREFKNKIRYNFKEDNHFEEMKNTELLRERISTLRDMEDLIGRFYSEEWVFKNVLRLDDIEINDMQKQMKKEDDENPLDQDGNPKDGPTKDEDNTSNTADNKLEIVVKNKNEEFDKYLSRTILENT